MMTIPLHLRPALRSLADYSPAFSDEIRKIAELISKIVGVDVHRDADMNYRASQRISLEFSSASPYGIKKDGEICATIYISSRARLFCFYCFDAKGIFYKDGPWKHPAPVDLFPLQIGEVIRRCRGLLIDRGYEEVERQLFDELAPDCFTELDHLPATVFQVLFAEVV
jgi:hypothetical protein